jgi:hypothetical protein
MSTISPAYTLCAPYLGTCEFTGGPRSVAYTATDTSGKTYYRNPTTSIPCSDIYFGNPSAANDKHCVMTDIPAYTTDTSGKPVGFTWCANDGGTCSPSNNNKPADILYGTNGSYVYAHAISLPCDGNVLQGGKGGPGLACYWRPSVKTPAVIPACKTTTDCTAINPDWACVNGGCRSLAIDTPCADADDCRKVNPNWTCYHGKCQSPADTTGCKDDKDCTTPYWTCVEGACRAPLCENDKECETWKSKGWTCNTDDGTCLEPSEPTGPPGSPKCGTDADCKSKGDGWTCNKTTGKCEAPKGIPTWVWIVIGVGVVVLLIFGISLFWYFWKKGGKKRRNREEWNELEELPPTHHHKPYYHE